MSQRERIIQYIRDFGSITSWEAVKDLGCMRLGARIFELKKQGFTFGERLEKGKNRYGDPCHWKRFYLKEQ